MTGDYSTNFNNYQNNDVCETDDYCIPGGSMKGIINYNSEIMMNKMEIEENSDRNTPLNLNIENDDINNYKKIIEKQEKLIGHLINILSYTEAKQTGIP